MRKISFYSLALVALTLPLGAEKSGYFIGASYHMGSASFTQKTLLQENSQSTSNQISSTRPEDGVGLKLGYKQFFGDGRWFGLRYYAFLNYGYVDFGRFQGKPYHAHMLDYGIGSDVLYQVFDLPNLSFGFFCGIGIGADSWKERDFYHHFQTTIDVGLRTNIYQHHGFEVGAKVPFWQSEDYKTSKSSEANITKELQTNISYNSSFYIGYFYTF
ncbi:hypothetical protein BKH46_05920 [Helicobacter sp. 12S02634-8]|uniref:outer membrane protein n=1 Tax=Helicobacter sp. 12S02634-8 TaxID=1476199 RepID=UPI000BCEC8FF|nr:outer membrane protein [Helicobacter sp. 12S02634-8]PAF46973.1 hypothetical protein BKH46_05920 [Helicobacter sp. 12S02634-8]